jgi:hypothetical protein
MLRGEPFFNSRCRQVRRLVTPMVRIRQSPEPKRPLGEGIDHRDGTVWGCMGCLNFEDFKRTVWRYDRLGTNYQSELHTPGSRFAPRPNEPMVFSRDRAHRISAF